MKRAKPKVKAPTENLIHAARRALRWFEKCNQPGDKGCDWLNDHGFNLTDAIELDLNAALAKMRVTPLGKEK